ncbi:MAG TPA: hypothetical protein VF148_04220 [Acidimicrobiia bacterium]
MKPGYGQRRRVLIPDDYDLAVRTTHMATTPEPAGAFACDYLTGHAGEDEIYGQLGDDFALGGTGDDFALGGTGDDIVQGDDGRDMEENIVVGDPAQSSIADPSPTTNDEDRLFGDDERRQLSGGTDAAPRLVTRRGRRPR